MATKTITITGPRIDIKGKWIRYEIVKRVVNQFIETEYAQKGFGIKFQYPVETLPTRILMIGRPGRKKNFDFKVLVELSDGLNAGEHADVIEDFCHKAESRHRDALLAALGEIYHCSEEDVDVIISRNTELKGNLGVGTSAEILLKIIKWMFIMEDIFYWDTEGRAFLFNYLNYVVHETDKARLARARADVVKRPANLRRYMKQSGLDWTVCKG